MKNDKPGMSTPQCMLKTKDGGIRCYPDGMFVTAYAMSDRIIIKGNKKMPQIKIPYEQIHSCCVTTDREEKQKSVLGRAAVGALVFGPAGAIVGSVSGLGSKTKERKTFHLFYEDNYGRYTNLSAEIYGDTGALSPYTKFEKELKKHVQYLSDLE